MSEESVASMFDPKSGEGTLSLSFTKDQFGTFFDSLLGKQQTLDKVFDTGRFILTPEHIQSLDSVLGARVSAQNRGALVAFSVQLFFQDNSSTRINSLADLISHRIINNTECNGLEVSWTYLIHFPNKTAPEKQTIELSANVSPEGIPRMISQGRAVPAVMFGPCVYVRVSHTDRTWGTDIRQWLTGEIEPWMIPHKGLAKKLSDYSEWIARGIMGLILVIIAITILIAANRLEAMTPLLIQSAGSSSTLDMSSIILSHGIWSRFTIAAIIYFLVAGVVSKWIGEHVEYSMPASPKSFLLFSDASHRAKDEYTGKRRRRWRRLVIEIAVALICNLIASIIFVILIQPLMGAEQ